MFKKRSFFEKLTGSVRLEDDEQELDVYEDEEPREVHVSEDEDAQLTLDVYETPTEIIIQTMVAGVRPEELDIDITRDTVTVRGKREEKRAIDEENYFLRELYWGSFSRTVSLPVEIDPEEAEALERHGLLMIKLPKLDRDRRTKLRVKSLES